MLKVVWNLSWFASGFRTPNVYLLNLIFFGLILSFLLNLPIFCYFLFNQFISILRKTSLYLLSLPPAWANFKRMTNTLLNFSPRKTLWFKFRYTWAYVQTSWLKTKSFTVKIQLDWSVLWKPFFRLPNVQYYSQRLNTELVLISDIRA